MMLNLKLLRNMRFTYRVGVSCAMIGLAGLVAGCPFLQLPVDLCTGVTCDAGLTCDPNTGGCVAAPECTTDTDCDDTDECTTEACVNGECVNNPITCDDNDECTTDTCDAATGCAYDPKCPDGQECDADTGDCVSTGPEEFQNASAARGGVMYDKWWVVAEVDEPTDDHPMWADRATDPGTGDPANARDGSESWRCKECHGWDYKGVDGAYASGSHMTGFAGIFGTTLTPQEVFEVIHTDHGFHDTGLYDADIWDLTKFVLEGQIDTDEIIDADNAFIGDEANGATLYSDGIGGNLACAICHGADGLTINFKEPPDEEFLGDLARGNPWEFQHKVRFGHPGTAMPASVDVDATNDDVADVGAHSQTLGMEADGDATPG